MSHNITLRFHCLLQQFIRGIPYFALMGVYTLFLILEKS